MDPPQYLAYPGTYIYNYKPWFSFEWLVEKSAVVGYRVMLSQNTTIGLNIKTNHVANIKLHSLSSF